ncbi:MAG: type II toxin-antitoxin system PemK/MazF family toxin [Lachnospiraceae bacterium]|nr:type II toxin-antitoxin system PemK/MazF family toxin [Lachnospiraceae bacterium]
MFEILQGDILSVEKIPFPVLVVSKNYFNRGEKVIVCPIRPESQPGPLHIYVETQEIKGVAECEQLRMLDLRLRGYRKRGEICMEAIMDITDAIQGIFDYYPYNA